MEILTPARTSTTAARTMVLSATAGGVAYLVVPLTMVQAVLVVRVVVAVAMSKFAIRMALSSSTRRRVVVLFVVLSLHSGREHQRRWCGLEQMTRIVVL